MPICYLLTLGSSKISIENVNLVFNVSIIFPYKNQSLLCAHDAIAQKDFYPHLPEIPMEMDEDEETIKIVQLVKSNEPLVGTKLLSFIDFLCNRSSYC